MNGQKSKLPLTDKPDYTQIERWLSEFKPQSSIRFYTRMKKAPWVKKTFDKRVFLDNDAAPARKMLLGMTLILLILVLIGILFIPSVRAVARQIIYSFIYAPSNQLEIHVTSSNPVELFHFSDPANFPLTIQDVQGQAGFVVKEIKPLPVKLTLVGSRFEPSYNAVIILYQGDDYKLYLSQRPVGKGEDVFSIGSTAQVNLVKVGNHQAEFVVGGWKAISTQTISITLTPGSQTNIDAIWDSNLPQYTLRWQDEGFIYELRSVGEGNPIQSELIALANELK
jgi:hypothetical protein